MQSTIYEDILHFTMDMLVILHYYLKPADCCFSFAGGAMKRKFTINERLLKESNCVSYIYTIGLIWKVKKKERMLS